MLITIFVTLILMIMCIALWFLLEAIGVLFALTFGLGGVLFRLIFYVVRIGICCYIAFYVGKYLFDHLGV